MITFPRQVRSLLFLIATVVLSLLGSTAQADGPAPSPSQSQFETRFLQEMIDHHAMAVEMAAICEGKDIRAELKALCTDIRTNQLQEIATMRTWLEDSYMLAYSPAMNSGEENRMSKLAELNGDAFEIEFMETMIKHHRMAVRRAAQCIEKAYHEELVELCTSMIADQDLEIEAMQLWLCQWHGICRGPGTNGLPVAGMPTV